MAKMTTARRNEIAQSLGYKNYAERRKVLSAQKTGLSPYQRAKNKALSDGYKSVHDKQKQRRKERERLAQESKSKSDAKSLKQHFEELIGGEVDLINLIEDLPPDRKRAIEILIERGVEKGYMKEQTIEDILRDSPDAFWPTVRPYLDQTPEWI